MSNQIHSHATESSISQPPGLPVLGHTLAYLRDPFEFMTQSAQYGRIVRWEFLNQTIYQLTEPTDIEQVLVHDNQYFVKGALIQKLLGSINENGVLVTEGDVWRRQRTLLNPTFHPERLTEYTTTMTEMTERMIARWQAEERRDIHSDLMELTLEIVANALFGIDIRNESVTISDALDVIMARSENAFIDVVPRWAPTPSNRRFHRAVEQVETIVATIIEERRRDPGADVVSALLAANDDGGLSDEEIKAQVMTLLLAGHETTALALTYTLYLVAQHPEVEQKLLAEVDDVLDGRPPGADDLPNLTYTEQVVKEAMRLYPPVHTIIRESADPVELAGYHFPAERRCRCTSGPSTATRNSIRIHWRLPRTGGLRNLRRSYPVLHTSLLVADPAAVSGIDLRCWKHGWCWRHSYRTFTLN